MQRDNEKKVSHQQQQQQTNKNLCCRRCDGEAVCGCQERIDKESVSEGTPSTPFRFLSQCTQIQRFRAKTVSEIHTYLQRNSECYWALVERVNVETHMTSSVAERRLSLHHVYSSAVPCLSRFATLPLSSINFSFSKDSQLSFCFLCFALFYFQYCWSRKCVKPQCTPLSPLTA